MDASPVVFKAAEAAGGGFESLAGSVEGFSQRIGDSVAKVAQQAGEMIAQGAGDFSDRFQGAAPRLGIPLREVALGRRHVGLFSKLQEHHLVVIGSRSAQVLPGHGLEGFELGAGQFVGMPEP